MPPTPANATRPHRLLAVFLGLLATVAAIVMSAPARAQPQALSVEVDPAAPLVVIGTGGLIWDDLSPEATPAMWEFAEAGAVGNLVVRSIRSTTCPADGWLALSAGARAADLAYSERTSDFAGNTCRPLRPADDGVVPGWEDYLTAAAQTGYDPRLGLFGDLVLESDLHATAIGPGAAIALGTADGTVAGTALELPETPGEITAVVSDAVVSNTIVVIDAGQVRDYVPPAMPTGLQAPATPDPETFRAEQVAEIETRVAAILAGIEQAIPLTDASTGEDALDPVIFLASLSDSGRSPAMHVLAEQGIGEGTLTSPSTRQVGYVQSTDLLPTFLGWVGIGSHPESAQGAIVGSPVGRVETASSGSDRIAALADAELHAQAQRPIIAPFYLTLVILNVVLYAVVALGLTRPAATRLGASIARFLRLDGRSISLTQARPHVLKGLRFVAVAMAAIPVSTFLANLLPWWRGASPALWFALATLAICLVVTALAIMPPWGSRILAPMGVVAGITAAVLAVDIATGARLQISAIMGVPVLVAGRFYGFNNTAFSLFTTASILLVVAVTNPWVRRGWRGLAAAVTAMTGLVVAYLDGAPSIGADFGGPPAILPAFAVLALLAAGVRITWKRAVLVLGGAALATAALAVADYLRPAEERTHLGMFVETTLNGGAWDVIYRKLEANLRILANNRPLTILAITGVALVVFVLARPVRRAITSPGGGRFSWLSSGAPISQMGSLTPMLGPGLVALGVALGIGFALNDSGIAIPAYGVAVAVPLLLAACANWMLTLAPGERHQLARQRAVQERGGSVPGSGEVAAPGSVPGSKPGASGSTPSGG